MSRNKPNPSSFKPQSNNTGLSTKTAANSQQSSSKNNKSRLMDILADVMKAIMSEHGKFQTQDFKKNSEEVVGYENKDFRNEGENISESTKRVQVICISNSKSVPKSKYGQQYKNSLDPRDRLLAHPFQFILEISPNQDNQGSFIKSSTYARLSQKIQEYLVDVVENVVSVSFNLLIEQKLKENQSKDYASKNILMNVYSLFKEIIETLTSEDIASKKEIKKLRFSLIELVDNTLNQILSNLAPYYPQAPPTGGTPRMREAILSIDRNFNEELDFLYTQGLKLKVSDDNDYTGYIMNVINRAIHATSEIDHKDPLRQTLFQKFVAFSENLFWVAQQDQYEKVIKSIQQDDDSNTAEAEEIDLKGQKQYRNSSQQAVLPQESQQQNNYCGFFSNCAKRIPELDLKKKAKDIVNNNVKKQIAQYMRKPIFAESSRAILIPETAKQKKIEEMKHKHEFAIGQKIPNSVKPFSKKDITDKNFSAKHSAVLRMLTKWAENLENIFDHPQAYTLNRTYPFKTLNHQIIYPKKQLKQNLYKNLIAQTPKKEKVKNYLITRNKVFQSTFFSLDNTQNISKLIKRYTETRVMASKINALLIQFMKEYVSRLIKLLIDAGKTSLLYKQGQYQMEKKYDINLVVFKIGDLMRSKIHCSETSFIRLLKTLYILQEVDCSNERHPITGQKRTKQPLFELVRIKNKLDTKDNNILINYLFMGKIQCELQLSVQNVAGKEMNYYMFSHFLYELTRGTFGVLSQCATIISQHDPIVSSSSSDLYYEPKNQKKPKILVGPKQQPKNQELKEQKDSVHDKTLNMTMHREGKKGVKMFVCEKCQKLKFQQNLDFLKREDDENEICNDCLITSTDKVIQAVFVHARGLDKFNSEGKLKDEQMSRWIIQNLKNSHIEKLNKYEQLSEKSDEKTTYLIFSLSHKRNELEFNIFNYQQSQNVYFICRITKQILEKDQTKEKDVEYQNITNKIRNGGKFPEYTYIMPISQNQVCMKILSRIKFIKLEHVIEKLQDISEKCREKILKDSILNVLRNRNQSIQFNSSNQKLRKMKSLVDQGQLKDSKYKWIEQSLGHLQFIFAEKTKMDKLPQWVLMCQKMQLINLSNNHIKDVSDLENMTELTEIILHDNEITQIDCQKLTNLERLNISHNKLNSFDLKSLPTNILEVDIGYNGLTTLDLQNISRYLPKLKKLDAFGNDIKTLNLLSLPETLQHIDMSFNHLQSIEYTKLPAALQVKYLNHNNLTSFQVGDMLHLHELLISDNKLNNFSIRNCPSLTRLNLGSNLLVKIELNDFQLLHELSIEDNPSLTHLVLKNLPSIDVVNMKSLNYKRFDHLQIEHLNHDGVYINHNAEILNFLNNKFPHTSFYELDEEEENNYSFNNSIQEYLSRPDK